MPGHLSQMHFCGGGRKDIGDDIVAHKTDVEV